MELENCVVALVLKTPETPTLANDERLIAIHAGLIDRDKLVSAIGDLVGQREFDQIFAGLVALRTSSSNELTEYLLIRTVDRNKLTATNVYSAEALERLDQGGALVSRFADIARNVQEGGGRPVLSSAQRSLRGAMAMVVARLDVLGGRGEANQADYWSTRERVGTLIDQFESSLFNMNDSHRQGSSSPAMGWCETEGPGLLAAAYGLDWEALERQLAASFDRRIKRLGFSAAVRYEEELLGDLCQWTNAHHVRREGERSRADTVKRGQKTRAGSWVDQPQHGQAAPPRMHKSVRNNLVAQGRLDLLSESRMVELSLLFGLEPAHDVFLTRHYLLPVLAVAALVGTLVLRRQDALVASPLAAGGLIALNASFSWDDSPRHDPPRLDADIRSMQEKLAERLSEAGHPPALLSAIGRRYLLSRVPRQPRPVAAKEGVPVFFVE